MFHIDSTFSSASAAFRSASIGQLFPPTCSVSLRSRVPGIGRFEPLQPDGRAGVDRGEPVEHDLVAVRQWRGRIARAQPRVGSDVVTRTTSRPFTFSSGYGNWS